MRRNSFPKEKVGGGNIPITFGARCNIFDCGGTIFNTQLDITSNVDLIHSLPTIYAPLYIYSSSCKTSYPNSEFLFSQILDLFEIIFSQNNMPIKLSASSPINVDNAVKDEDTKSQNPFLSAIKMLNPEKINFPNYNLIKCELNGIEEILGITSPFTFVCPSANIANTHFYRNNPNFFHKTRALEKRSDLFIAYMADILNQIDNSKIVENEKSNLSPFRSHLKGLLDKIKDTQGKLPALNEKAYNDSPFISLSFKKDGSVKTIVLKYLEEVADVRSPYKIQPTKKLDSNIKRPLVLKSGSSGWYFNEYSFPDDFKVSGYGSDVLPVYNYNYEWVNPLVDFLEPNLITLDYELNREFLRVGSKKEGRKKCLLPLKPKFFEYFEGKDIDEFFEIEIQPSGKEWKVKLSIPIIGDGKPERLQCEKTYTLNKRETTDTIGSVTELKGDDCPYFAFWPTIKSNLLEDYYLIVFNESDYNLNVNCFSQKQGQKLIVNREKVFSVNKFANSFPDFIQFNFSNISETFSGIVSPNAGEAIDFTKKSLDDSKSETFVSIDFGTTNTNIGIFMGGKTQDIWSFDNDSLFTYLHSRDTKENKSLKAKVEDLEKLSKTYFLPKKIAFNPNAPNDPIVAQIPIGSLLLELNNKISIQHKEPICNLNIPFFVEYGTNADNQLAFEFKWGGGNLYIQKYLAQLLTMLKVYLIKNKIDPREAILLTAYPMAYSITQVSEIKLLWNTLITEVGFKEPRMINEGSASRIFFSEAINLNLGTSEGTSIVLDIGGGTTDFCITSNQDSVVIDSLLYGGRDIIGWFSSANEDPASLASNPIVRYLEKLVHEEKLYSYLVTSNEYKKNVNSQLKFRYLMSSTNYDKLDELILANPNFSFVKIVLGYFYLSVFYYLGMLCKSKKELAEKTPSLICIGGNSSRYLDWLLKSRWEGANNQYLVEEIFNEFFQLGFDKASFKSANTFKIVKSDQPKNEVVRGLLLTPPEKDESISARYTKRYSIFGDNIVFGGTNYSYSDQQSEKGEDPQDQSYGKKVTKADTAKIYFSTQGQTRLAHFNEKFWDALNKRELFSDVFQSTIGKGFFEQAKEIFTNNSTYTNILREEIDRYMKDTVSQDISTPFFILAAKGMLHKLIREVSVFVGN